MTSHFTRSKAHRPSTPALEESDVELDDVVPVAATHPVSDTTPARSSVAAAGEPGSMATEPAGTVSVPTPPPSPEGKPSSSGGPGTPGPAGSPPVGLPSGLAGPTEFDTQVRGQKLPFPPDVDPSHTPTESKTSVVFSGSGVPGPDAGVGTPAAAAAVE